MIWLGLYTRTTLLKLRKSCCRTLVNKKGNIDSNVIFQLCILITGMTDALCSPLFSSQSSSELGRGVQYLAQLFTWKPYNTGSYSQHMKFNYATNEPVKCWHNKQTIKAQIQWKCTGPFQTHILTQPRFWSLWLLYSKVVIIMQEKAFFKTCVWQSVPRGGTKAKKPLHGHTGWQ